MRYVITRSNPWMFDPFFDDDEYADWNAVSDTKFPPVNVYEDAKQYVLEAELPGYEQNDLQLHVEDHVLHLSSQKRMSKHDKRNYLMKERVFVPFERTFSLPDHVDESAIKADFSNGLLSVVMPKVQPEQPKRIDVKLN